MTRSASRTFVFASILSLAFVLAAPFALAAQPQPEKLTHPQLTALIASASTPADHQRLVRYYQAQAQEYRTQAAEHQAMVAAYKANPGLANEKTRLSTLNHCEHFVTSFQDLAAHADALALAHQKMADAK